ncbi:MAG: GAF domain-containing protein [Myxococcales bacterium]|nr:GAF domain-containing protein [Myxococcales bacterium]
MTAPAKSQERHLRDLEFLADVTREALSTLRVGALLWRVVQLLRHRFGYEFACISLVERDALIVRAASGVELPQDIHEPQRDGPWRMPLGCGIPGMVAQSGESRLVADCERDQDFVRLEGLERSRCQLCVPLIHREEVIGVIDVHMVTPGALDETDLHLLQIVAALVAPAVSTARAFEHERERSRQMRLINEISRLISGTLNRDEVIELACRAILEGLDVSFSTIVLLDRTGKHVVHGGHAAREPFVEGFEIDNMSLELGEGISGHVIQSGQTMRIPDVSKDPHYREIVKGIKSALCVPLKVQGRAIGALCLESTSPSRFSDEDEDLLENLAGFLAQAIDNARLFDSQRRRWLQLLLINEVARVSSGTIDLGEILRVVAEQVHDRFGYYGVVVFLVEDREVVVRAVATDAKSQIARGDREPIGGGIAGTVAKHGQTVRLDDPSQFGGSRPISNEVQSILAVPLTASEQVIGVLQVHSRDPAAFDDDDRLVVETLAKSVSGSISNARSIAQAERLREDLNRMIVHDLRNPVQAVLLTLQEVAMLSALEPNKLESINTGIHCTEDILEMVNSLLDVSRFEAGRAKLRRTPASLNDHIRAVVRRFAPQARSKGIQVTTVLSQEVPVLRLDHELVRRMLGNLVGNALKFTPDGAPVTIKSELLEEGSRRGIRAPVVVVSVRDKGEGIPDGYHDKIFEKFGQVETRKAGLKMSTGLGLALCRYVVEAHGGVIWVESSIGEGSTFYVALPAAMKSR